MNGYFAPQGLHNVGKTNQLSAMNCERSVTLQNDFNRQQDTAAYYQPYYPANINFGVQNIYYNNCPPQANSVVQLTSDSNHQQQQQHPFVESILAENKVLDARPESLWEANSDSLKLPSLPHAHAVELRNGFSRVDGQQKVVANNFTTAEVDAVSALASLGRSDGSSCVFRGDATRISGNQKQNFVVDHQSPSYCQNVPQVNQLNQSYPYEFNNSQHLYRPTFHRPTPERYANGGNFDAAKLKTYNAVTNNRINDVCVNNETDYVYQQSSNSIYHGGLKLPFGGQISLQTPTFHHSYTNIGATLPLMQNLALKLETSSAASCPVAGPLSQDSPAYKSFCVNSLDVDGRTSSWQSAIVQKSPVIKTISPRARQQQMYHPNNEISNKPNVVVQNQTGCFDQTLNVMLLQQQQHQIQNKLQLQQQQYQNVVNGQSWNSQNKCQWSQTHLSPNGLNRSREVVVLQSSQVEVDTKAVMKAAINQHHQLPTTQIQGYVSPKKIPQCQLGDILAKKQKTPINEKPNVPPDALNSMFLQPKLEQDQRQQLRFAYGNEMITEENSSLPLVGAKEFVNEFIRQLDCSVSTRSPDVKIEMKPEIPLVAPEVKQQSVKKTTKAKMMKASSKLARSTPPYPSSAKQTKKEKISEMSSAKTIKPYVAMPKVTQSDPLTLSGAGFTTLLAVNAKSASLKRKEKCFISTLPSFLGSPVRTTKKVDEKSSLVDAATKNNTDASQSVVSSAKLSSSSLQTPSVDGGVNQLNSDHIRLWNGTFETEESLLYRLTENITQPLCWCDCLKGAEIQEDVEGPYYTHLGAAGSVAEMRRLMEQRFGESGAAIRIEKVIYTGKEGKTTDGCPIAKWIIRRSSYDEKVLCLVRKRPDHHCATAVLCVLIVVWDGVPTEQANDLYDCLTTVLPVNGIPTNRRCELNEKRSCACQGVDETTAGASFSFGCSWSMYYNTCKFAKSSYPKKFKMNNPHVEQIVEDKCHLLADAVGPMYKQMAPASYKNQAYFSNTAQGCRLGYNPGGPFCGITACVDFCAHSHKDNQNMNNGCTVVVTLTKHRGLEKPNDEQLHVLPMYVMDETDEHGSSDGQLKKINKGLEVLTKYPMNLRMRRDKMPSCRKRAKMKLERSVSVKKRKLTNNPAVSPAASLPDISSSSTTSLQNSCNNFEHNRSTESIPPQFGNANYFNGTSTNFQTFDVGGQQFYPADNQQAQSNFNCHNYSNINQTVDAANRPSYHVSSNFSTNQSNNTDNGYVNYTSNWPAAAPFQTANQNFQSWNGVAQEVVVGNNNYSSTPNAASSSNLSQFSVDQLSSSSDLNNAKRKLSFDSPRVDDTKGYFYQYTENETAFNDPLVGGVAVALSHGSVLFEVAKRELHATTALRVPDRRDPKRISLVFYQHKHMNYERHGAAFYAANQSKKSKERRKSGDDDNDASADRRSHSSTPESSDDLPIVEPLPPTDDWSMPCKRWTTPTKPVVVTVNANASAVCRVSGQYSLKG